MAGVLLVVFPIGLGLGLLLGILVIAIFRKFSLGSLLGAVALPVIYLSLNGRAAFGAERLPVLILVLAGGLLILFRHAANIRRLLRGSELGLQANHKEGS